jgi:adenosylcobinamide-GDP ribazoletransferase
MKHILAAFMFFTRLPFWRLADVEKEYFKNVVNFWPWAGIITGGIGAWVMLGASFFLPPVVAVVLGIAARVLVTGALHEDGLADFFDGFGGGRDKESILRIMKDSHIGSYGVLGLVFYFALLVAVLSSMPIAIAASLFFFGDIFCKFISSNMVNLLPYSRKEEESKNKLIYNRMPVAIFVVNLVSAALLMWGIYTLYIPFAAIYAAAVPCVLFLLLVWYMKRKIQGYTGDCCGASFLLCELSFYIASLAILNVQL